MSSARCGPSAWHRIFRAHAGCGVAKIVARISVMSSLFVISRPWRAGEIIAAGVLHPGGEKAASRTNKMKKASAVGEKKIGRVMLSAARIRRAIAPGGKIVHDRRVG